MPPSQGGVAFDRTAGRDPEPSFPKAGQPHQVTRMEILLDAIISGIMMGLIFALVALGLTIIFGVMDVVNFAHGEFLMLGMYTAYWSYAAWGLDPPGGPAPVCGGRGAGGGALLLPPGAPPAQGARGGPALRHLRAHALHPLPGPVPVGLGQPLGGPGAPGGQEHRAHRHSGDQPGQALPGPDQHRRFPGGELPDQPHQGGQGAQKPPPWTPRRPGTWASTRTR